MSGLWKRTALALTLATLALPAQANDYPSKSITIMPLLAAGTGLDIAVRLYGEELSKSLGKPVVKGAKVKAAVLGSVQGEKIYVQKFARRKNYRRTQGHRQYFTEILIKEIAC